MDVLIIISQTALYLAISILVGTLILLSVPESARPNIKVSKNVLLLCAGLIPLLCFVPVLDIIWFLTPRLGFVQSLSIVLTTNTIGTAWDFTFLLSLVLVAFVWLGKIEKKPGQPLLGVGIIFGIIFTISLSSHASSIRQGIGILFDFLHLASVSIWVGILFVIGWFSTNRENWILFLNWFSYVALSCLLTIAFSGLFMMNIILENYKSSLLSSYSQGLLVKLLFIFPVLLYAFVNRFVIKRKIMVDCSFNPIPWIRLEGFLLFIIFSITAFFTQQDPPHRDFLTEEAVSSLFRLIHGDFVIKDATISFSFSVSTFCFFLLSILFFALLIATFLKKIPIFSFLFCCLFVLSTFFMILTSVVVG